jgi:hypothetical protein
METRNWLQIIPVMRMPEVFIIMTDKERGEDRLTSEDLLTFAAVRPAMSAMRPPFVLTVRYDPYATGQLTLGFKVGIILAPDLQNCARCVVLEGGRAGVG